MVYLNVVLYKEVRRNDKPIAANQVSLEVKEKMLKNKKAFYITLIILLTIFLCFFPGNICFIIVLKFSNEQNIRWCKRDGYFSCYFAASTELVM